MHQTIDLSLLEHTQVPIMDELFLTRSDLPARYTFLTPRWTALAHVSYNDIDQITWARPEINPGCIRKDTGIGIEQAGNSTYLAEEIVFGFSRHDERVVMILVSTSFCSAKCMVCMPHRMVSIVHCYSIG